jgi:hypothetical protein
VVNLQYASLLNPPHYTALSYTWGDPNVTQMILLNGKDHEATTNLDAALRQVRRQLQDNQKIRLWVDALCINQEDIDERSEQVLRIKYIYKRAEDVLVCIGSEEDESQKAMRLLEYLSRIDID